MLEIKIWAQMFFDDGSVTQGVRIPVETLDDDRLIEDTARMLLRHVNRDKGLLLLWGAGNLQGYSILLPTCHTLPLACPVLYPESEI